MPILETTLDRGLQYKTIKRLKAMRPEDDFIEMPKLALMDYLVLRDGTPIKWLEIKTRKESVDQIKRYGGLLLKHRKIAESIAMADAIKVEAFFLWTFDNGDGPMMVANPRKLLNLVPQPPRERKNARNLACDKEYVVYLDWDEHLTRID